MAQYLFLSKTLPYWRRCATNCIYGSFSTSVTVTPLQLRQSPHVLLNHRRLFKTARIPPLKNSSGSSTPNSSSHETYSVPKNVEEALSTGMHDMEKLYRHTLYFRRLVKFGILLATLGTAVGMYYYYFSNSPGFSVFGGSSVSDMQRKGLLHDMFKTTANFVTEVNVKFSDVKGCDEAKQELQLVVDFLRNPERFFRVGAKLPKGVLLVGPPGVGKTLLAKAVAGEANVAYLHAVGSEFDEIFVGTGAARIRALFKEAQRHAPCVIFIDEFDAVGGRRVSSQVHPYANQTINQLLSEMDGFKSTEGIIVLAATNKKEHLDNAILRPGRFDFHIHLSPPDLAGRMELFQLYLDKVKWDQNTIRKETLAAGTAGFTGADIQNMVNQATIHAGLLGQEHVTMEDMWYARDKIIMGAAKKRIPDAAANEMFAYHEAGHTLVGLYTPECTPLHKVTIVPRGQAMGMTTFIPDKDMHNYSKAQLLAMMDMSMGGRVGEELVYGPEKVSTGAGSDFQKATQIAESMVRMYGMSERLGPRTFSANSKEEAAAWSPSSKELIDAEVKRLLQESYERAKKVLQAHATEHKLLAEALLKYETLDSADVMLVIRGEKPKNAVELDIKLNDPQLNPKPV